MKEEYKLETRDGTDNRLIKVDDKKYRLKTPFCYRTGFESDNPDIITFIDPSGGPFITPGFEVDGHKVKAIHKHAIIEFE